MRELAVDPELIDDPWIFDEIPGLDDPATLDPGVALRLVDAVEGLPEDERAVVECLMWGQMTKVEVAEILGRSRQSVHDVYKRALVKLREQLADLTPTKEKP